LISHRLWRSISVFSRSSLAFDCWFSFNSTCWFSFSIARRDSLRSSSRIGSPFVSVAPGRFRIFSTRASAGLEITCSNAGVAVPEAVIGASSGPVSTFAVRMRARATVGLISRGPQTKTAATSAAAATIIDVLRHIRCLRKETSSSLSIDYPFSLGLLALPANGFEQAPDQSRKACFQRIFREFYGRRCAEVYSQLFESGQPRRICENPRFLLLHGFFQKSD